MSNEKSVVKYEVKGKSWYYGELAHVMSTVKVVKLLGPCPICDSPTYVAKDGWLCSNEKCGYSSEMGISPITEYPEWWTKVQDVKTYKNGYIIDTGKGAIYYQDKFSMQLAVQASLYSMYSMSSKNTNKMEESIMVNKFNENNALQQAKEAIEAGPVTNEAILRAYGLEEGLTFADLAKRAKMNAITISILKGQAALEGTEKHECKCGGVCGNVKSAVPNPNDEMLRQHHLLEGLSFSDLCDMCEESQVEVTTLNTVLKDKIRRIHTLSQELLDTKEDGRRTKTEQDKLIKEQDDSLREIRARQISLLNRALNAEGRVSELQSENDRLSKEMVDLHKNCGNCKLSVEKRVAAQLNEDHRNMLVKHGLNTNLKLDDLCRFTSQIMYAEANLRKMTHERDVAIGDREHFRSDNSALNEQVASLTQELCEVKKRLAESTELVVRLNSNLSEFSAESTRPKNNLL